MATGGPFANYLGCGFDKLNRRPIERWLSPVETISMLHYPIEAYWNRKNPRGLILMFWMFLSYTTICFS